MEFLPKARVSSVLRAQGVKLYCPLDLGCNYKICLYSLPNGNKPYENRTNWLKRHPQMNKTS